MFVILELEMCSIINITLLSCTGEICPN